MEKKRPTSLFFLGSGCPEVLEAVHNGVGGGHLGVNKMLGKVRESFYWLNSHEDVDVGVDNVKIVLQPRDRKLKTEVK